MSWLSEFVNGKSNMLGETLKKRACTFILGKCGDGWLKQSEYNLDQLTLDLYNGRMQFHNFELDAAAINHKLRSYDLPFEFVDCFVGCLDVTVPWSSIFSDASQVEIKNLEITLRHRSKSSRKDFQPSSRMRSNIIMAEECIKSEQDFPNTPHFEGLYELAATFEAIFTRTRGTILDTTVCFEHIHDQYTTIFELKIAKVEYFGKESKEVPPDINENSKKKDKEGDMIRIKNLVFHGVKIYVGVDGELNRFGTSMCTARNVEKVLLVDVLGEPKIKIRNNEGDKSTASNMSVESHVEGINVILCPQIVRYLYKIFCEQPVMSRSQSDVSITGLKSIDAELFHSCVSDPVCIPVQGVGAKKINPSTADFSLTVSFISVVLLHSDEVRIDDDENDGEDRGSWHGNLRSLERGYLKVIRRLSHSKVAKHSDLLETRNIYSNVLNRSHFSLLIKHSKLKMTSSPGSELSLVTDLTLGLFDLSEVVIGETYGEVDYCNWLSFKEALLEKKDNGKVIVEPSIRFKVSKKQTLVNNIPCFNHFVAVTMSKCTSEFDITVMNRIRPIRAALLPTKSMHHLDEVENGSPCCNKVFLSLECVQWTPLVRFPKVGPIESFHSSRQLHDEFLQVEIQNLNIKTCITEFNFLEMSFASARANLMVEEEVHRMISIKSEGLSDSLRVSIKFNLRSRVTHNLCSAYSDNQETNFSELNVDGGAPFSLKKRMFKGRDLVLPAKRQEMKSNLVEEFSDSKVKVIVCLHQVVFYFPSKTVLDLLQNRLLMDALLWEVGTPDHIRFDSKHSIDSVGYESSKPDVVDNADDLCMPEKIWQRNALCVSIMIKEGRISLGMPETHNSRIFALAVSSLHFACVNHRHEDQESWSFSAQSENLEFSIESQESGKMFTKILQTSKDCFGLEDVKSAKDALSVAVLVNDNGMNRMQHNKVAVTLRNCILYHLETPANEKMWMSQLTDILSAIGAGNDSKTVSSSSSSRINSTYELHFSLKNCAVEYKPPSMAHRVILVTKSSHITNRNDLEPGGYEFSIYVEESGLFLGSKLPRLKKIDLRKDVVCVADINSVDFNLRQLNKFDEKCPQTKLSASINRFNLWTCSDSFAVLSQMIIHLANSKTLSPSPEQTLNEENGKVAIDSVVMEMMVENEDILTELLDDAMKYNFMPPSKYVIQKRKRNDSSTLDEKPIINVIADCPVEFENDSFVDLGSTCHMSSFQIPAQIPKVNLKFVENHFKDNSSQAQESNRQSVPVEKYHLHDTTITWYMFGGKDLTRTSKDPQMNHRKVDSRHRQKGISWREFCGQERDQSVLMEFHVKRIQAIHEVYPKGCEDHSRDVLLIKEVEVLDRLEVSGINKFLHPCFHSTANDNNMVKICVRHVRDDTNSLKRECELKISLMPVKLNIDQDSITFVCDFINEVTERVLIPPESSDQNKLKKFVELGMTGPSGGSVKELHQIYFRSIKFSPEVIIKIDYRGKMADRGSVKGLLASILHLDQSEIVLKRIIYRNGIRGVEKLMSLMMDEWVKDIKKNQISNMIKGIGPAGTIFNIARGVKDLLFMPVEQYRKDGRVVMGLQKGVSSFASCTLASSLELVYRSFNALQCLTQFAHDVVAMGGDDGLDGAKTSQKMKTPEDLREGFMGAYAIVKEGLNARAFEMRDALSPKNHRKGVAKTLGGILKQVPQTVIDPILVATKATTNFLEGARNQMLPEVKKEQMEKWKAR